MKMTWTKQDPYSCIQLGFKGIVVILLGIVALCCIALLAGYEYAQKEHPEPAHLEVLSQHVGRIEANLMRINALGQRLVETASLDPQEFNFNEEVGVGGGDLDTKTLKTLSAALERRYAQLETLEQVVHSRLGLSELAFSKSDMVVNKGWISSFFGYRRDPFSGRQAFHAGVDIVGKEGAEIRALASGIVSYATEKKRYGNLVEIQHANGLSTRYGHTKKILVKPGQLVRKGEVIALVGSTGRSTGPHVHVEVHEAGKAVDPGIYFPEFRKRRKSA